MKFILTLLFTITLILPLRSLAQTVESVETQKTNRHLISVPVAVSDREGHYVSGLKKEDFTIYENGVKQKIHSFATYDEPLSIALLLDTSLSTKDTLEKIKAAAKDFIELLNPADRCLIATFDAEVNVLNDLTGDQTALKTSLAKARTAAVEGTVVRRAVEQTLGGALGSAPGRKAIVLLSDGKDVGSRIGEIDLLNSLEESDVLIYTIFYKTGAGNAQLTIASDGTVKESGGSRESKKTTPKKKKKIYTVFIPAPVGAPSDADIEFLEKNADREAIDSLKKISDATAGRFYLSDASKLGEVLKRIAGELRQQYRLGYHSMATSNDQLARDIIVKVGRSDVVVRARKTSR